MICQNGELVAVRGKRALVEVKSGSACPTCRAGKGCGMGIFSAWISGGATRLELLSQPQWRIGDRIELQIAPGLLLRLSWMVYGLPLLCLLAGMAAGVYVAGMSPADDSDWWAGFGGLLGLGAALKWLRGKGHTALKIDARRTRTAGAVEAPTRPTK